MRREFDTLVLEASRLSQIHRKISKWPPTAGDGNITRGTADCEGSRPWAVAPFLPWEETGKAVWPKQSESIYSRLPVSSPRQRRR